MDKKTIIIALFLLSSLIGSAQKFSGGFFLSPSLTWMKPDISKNISNEGLKLGFSYGALGDLNIIGENFSLGLGILVNNIGGKISYADSIPEFKTLDSTYAFKPGAIVDYKLTYVELPIGLKGKTNEIGYMTYYMKSGITPMFKWKAKGDVTQGNISGESIKEEVASFMMGYYIGGGFQYNLGGTTSFVTVLVFSNGLTDITKTKTEDGKTDKVILNNIAIRIGIIF
ncbi:MAG TPA: PorT family protein [Bacteroidales bacterium]|nr:PorT family protein [Bacteroidales bacterium]